jgi:hypothetical protein
VGRVAVVLALGLEPRNEGHFDVVNRLVAGSSLQFKMGLDGLSRLDRRLVRDEVDRGRADAKSRKKRHVVYESSVEESNR